MRPIRREELLDLGEYERQRPEIRRRIIEEKARRRVHLGDHLTFLFENTDTARYQVHEMLRAERIVNEADIRHEIITYNEMLGAPGELGCVLLIEIDDAPLRDRQLREWLDLPSRLYLTTSGGRRVRPSCDPRQIGADRLSSVQYLKFDTAGEVPVAIGSDLASLRIEARIPEGAQVALAEDLASDAVEGHPGRGRGHVSR